jgi:hypothetical protein
MRSSMETMRMNMFLAVAVGLLWTTTVVLGDEAIEKVKRRFAFEEWEQRQKHSSALVSTNWTPNLAALPSTNIVLVTDEVTDGTHSRKWHAITDDGLHIYLDVVVLRSSRDAHEFMMKRFTRADLAKVEEDPSRGIGDRGFQVKTKQTVTGVVFIRGNVFVSAATFVVGKPPEDLHRIDLARVARVIDNQILVHKVSP